MESFAKINVRRTRDSAHKLSRGSSNAAATDVAFTGDKGVTIFPGEVVMLATGWSFELPAGIGMLILPRSGMATKHCLRPANTPGLLDPDYRGELFVALENFGEIPKTLEPGDYIAQLMFVPYYKPMFQILDSLSSTERGDGGFGSTEERNRR